MHEDPKRQPVGEDTRIALIIPSASKSGKSYAVACDNQFSAAREQVLSAKA